MHKLLHTLAFAFIVLGFAYFTWLSPEAREGKKNLGNSYKIRNGMHQREALKIMGPALYLYSDSMTVYKYKSHPYASDDIVVIVGADSLVKQINHGE